MAFFSKIKKLFKPKTPEVDPGASTPIPLPYRPTVTLNNQSVADHQNYRTATLESLLSSTQELANLMIDLISRARAEAAEDENDEFIEELKFSIEHLRNDLLRFDRRTDHEFRLVELGKDNIKMALKFYENRHRPNFNPTLDRQKYDQNNVLEVMGACGGLGHGHSTTSTTSIEYAEEAYTSQCNESAEIVDSKFSDHSAGNSSKLETRLDAKNPWVLPNLSSFELDSRAVLRNSEDDSQQSQYVGGGKPKSTNPWVLEVKKDFVCAPSASPKLRQSEDEFDSKDKDKVSERFRPRLAELNPNVGVTVPPTAPSSQMEEPQNQIGTRLIRPNINIINPTLEHNLIEFSRSQENSVSVVQVQSVEQWHMTKDTEKQEQGAEPSNEFCLPLRDCFATANDGLDQNIVGNFEAQFPLGDSEAKEKSQAGDAVVLEAAGVCQDDLQILLRNESLAPIPGPKLCKFGSQCRCDLNHKKRQFCKSAESCRLLECWYNHNAETCPTGIKCVQAECKRRHLWKVGSEEVEGSRPIAMQSPRFSNSGSEQLAPPSLTKTTAPPAKSPKISASKSQGTTWSFLNRRLLTKAIDRHNVQIKSITDQISAIQALIENPEDSSTDIDPDETEKIRGTILALRKHLAELNSQGLVFNEMTDRAGQELKGIELKDQLHREIFRLQSRLPALAKRLEIEAALDGMSTSTSGTNRFLIIQGQTGSGKSTQVAQYIADHPSLRGRKVICTQPRKIAAISLANRVSMEYAGGAVNAMPGYHIGYQVGGKRVGGRHCRIEYVTEGVMLERIMKGSKEPFQGVGCIIVDEAHERSILCDILLGSFKKEDERWKDIFIVVTSATIDLLEFSKFFNNAPTIEIEGRLFPVDIEYEEGNSAVAVSENLSVVRDEVVQKALSIFKSGVAGDILCFLPGQEDVLSAKASFEAEMTKIGEDGATKVLALYGRQEPEEQAKVFEKVAPPFRRKIIFATDVAETSVTIDGIVFVVDSGIKKEMVFDPQRNISSLKVNVISKSSAIQRAGRCGRTQPGTCFRLYSRADFENMNLTTAPEIFRRPLSLAVLSLREMNWDPAHFDWISAPPKEAILAADEELFFLKAVDKFKSPTELGKLISQTQQEPKLVRMIYRGCEQGFGMAALTTASILTVASTFFWNGKDPASKAEASKRKSALAAKDGDVVTMYRVFEQWMTIRSGGAVAVLHQDNNENVNLIPGPGPGDQQRGQEQEPDPGPAADAEELAQNNPGRPNPRIQQPNKKIIAEWAKTNSLNMKAIHLALSTRTELLAIFKTARVWKNEPSQLNLPTDLQLQRLVVSGFFMNAARLVQMKRARANQFQYIGLHAQVLGNIDNKGAILAAMALISDRDRGGNSNNFNFSPPSWLTFDKILRLSAKTIFTTTTVIEETWIREESQEFYELCSSKCHSLPTERIRRQVSQESLRTLAGRFCANLSALETQWNCPLEANTDAGILTAYCSWAAKQTLESKLDARITEIKQALANQVIEEDFLGGVRVVIGQGYEVKEILFAQEFNTLFFRNLPGGTTKELLTDFVRERTANHCQMFRTLEIHEANATAVVKFSSKVDAKIALELLKPKFYGNDIEVIPTGLGPKRGVTQQETSRLRISWALGFSEEKANVCFTSPTEANNFIDNINDIFPGARVSHVHGDLNFSGGRERDPNPKYVRKKQLPPAIVAVALGFDEGGRRRRRRDPSETQQRIRFKIPDGADDADDANFANNFDYKVTIVELNKYIDEQEIMARVKPAVPKWVKVDRVVHPETKPIYENGVPPEIRAQKLAPLKPFMKNLPSSSSSSAQTMRDYLDKNLCRISIYVQFDDTQTLQKAYRQADYFSIGDAFGQPHRIDVEYVHSTSVHVELFKYLENDIDEIKAMAWKNGVNVSEFPPRNSKEGPPKPTRTTLRPRSKFVTLRFRSCNASLIAKVQKKVEEISSCVKFGCENIHLLFTWTGKTLAAKIAEKTFIHWNPRTLGVWIYGGPNVQEDVGQELKNLVAYLKSLEILDKELMLNKKTVNLMSGFKCKSDVAKITKMCQVSKVAHFHFSGNKIFVSGSKDQVESLEKALDLKKYLFVRRPEILPTFDDCVRDCGICFCSLDSNFILTSSCGHGFCASCIEPMFVQQPPPFPIKCPQCEALMFINDIGKCAPQGSLRHILELSIGKYQEQNAVSVLICPKPGCGQLFSSSARRTGEYGGDFFYCDECITTYCMTCSKKLDKPIQSHDFDSCADVQNGPSNEVTAHVKEICEKIFNLSCPRCNVVFYDFVGCAAVKCEKCGCHFCGACLKDCGSSADAHTHVRNCSKNPGQDPFFISKDKLHRIHRKMRVEKLKAYLESNIKDAEVRAGVFRAIRRDLIDLGIDSSDIGLEVE